MSAEATPDISKVISVIMENPKLIEEIQSLVKSSEKRDGEVVEEEEEEAVTDKPVIEETKSDSVVTTSSTPTASPVFSHRQNRAKLLSALKPYVSTERAKALDSFMSIADILDMMRAR